jgi:glycine betaine/proline transport system substrate-binding protein
MDYLSKRVMPAGVTETMLVFGTENQASAQDMALEFLRVYPEVWTTWVSEKALVGIESQL